MLGTYTARDLLNFWRFVRGGRWWSDSEDDVEDSLVEVSWTDEASLEAWGWEAVDCWTFSLPGTGIWANEMKCHWHYVRHIQISQVFIVHRKLLPYCWRGCVRTWGTCSSTPSPLRKLDDHCAPVITQCLFHCCYLFHVMFFMLLHFLHLNLKRLDLAKNNLMCITHTHKISSKV